MGIPNKDNWPLCHQVPHSVAGDQAWHLFNAYASVASGEHVEGKTDHRDGAGVILLS